jgi:hypothetical protein
MMPLIGEVDVGQNDTLCCLQMTMLGMTIHMVGDKSDYDVSNILVVSVK